MKRRTWGGQRERAGRPKIMPNPVHKMFGIDAQHDARLKRHAQHLGISASQLVRDMIDWMISECKECEEPQEVRP